MGASLLALAKSIYYRLTCIMLSVGMVDNPEFWWTIFEFRGPKDVCFPLPVFSQSRVITFFSHQHKPLPFFFSRPKQLYQSYGYSRPTSRHTLPNLQDEIEDWRRKVDTNRFVSEIRQIWKDLMLLDSPNVHPPLKNNQRKKANFKCK